MKISAILDNPHSVMVFRNFILQRISEYPDEHLFLNIVCPSSLDLSMLEKFRFNVINYKRDVKGIVQLYKFFFKNSPKFLLLNDLGILNKILAVTLRAKRVYIIDDGIASIYRSLIDIFFINIRLRSFYYSMWDRVSMLQRGKFNQKFLSLDKENYFEDMHFYIASIKNESSINKLSEKNIIDKLKKTAISKNQKLIVLIHRANTVKEYHEDEIYYGVEIKKFNKSFEEIYLSSNFQNCSFSTFYSSALNVIGNEHQKFIVTSSYVDPEYKLKKTLLQRLFRIRRSALLAYDYYLSKGAIDLEVEIEPCSEL